jgi:hypothetical protein
MRRLSIAAVLTLLLAHLHSRSVATVQFRLTSGSMTPLSKVGVLKLQSFKSKSVYCEPRNRFVMV